MKKMPDSIFFTRLFVPQAPQSSPYRRAKSEIWLCDSFDAKASAEWGLL